MANRFSIDSPGRVLVLVRQQTVAELVKLTLNHGVFVARNAVSLADAEMLLNTWAPHLAIMETDLDHGRLLQQMQNVKSGEARLPVLALTRWGDLQTKLAAFDQGVDDVMSVPFSPEELLARVLVITRRSYGDPVKLTPVVKVGGLEIDILNREVRMGETVLHLTGVEQSLLYLFAANPKQLLTRDAITDAVWGVDFVADSNIVDRHIHNLRAKLEAGRPQPRLIATIAGQGYQFLPQETGATHQQPGEGWA